MNLKFSFFTGTICLLVSCNNQQQEPTAQQPELAENKPKTNPMNCYRYINKNDTVILKTIAVNDSITGILVYNFYEKDKNKGTIQGHMKGELLIADYSFASEGVQSTRQVAFKKNGETFVEGYGESEGKNGKTVFKNTDSLDFSHSIIFSAYDCEK